MPWCICLMPSSTCPCLASAQPCGTMPHAKRTENPCSLESVISASASLLHCPCLVQELMEHGIKDPDNSRGRRVSNLLSQGQRCATPLSAPGPDTRATTRRSPDRRRLNTPRSTPIRAMAERRCPGSYRAMACSKWARAETNSPKEYKTDPQPKCASRRRAESCAR